jgi:hypothetical protein
MRRQGCFSLGATLLLAAALLGAAVPAGAASAPADSAAAPPKVKKKHVFLAMGLSVVVPSAGQFYNGEHEKAVLQLALIGAGFAIRALARDEDDKTVLTDPGSWLIVLTWAWSIFDAPMSAHRINEERRAAAGLALFVAPLSRSPRVGVAFSF